MIIIDFNSDNSFMLSCTSVDLCNASESDTFEDVMKQCIDTFKSDSDAVNQLIAEMLEEHDYTVSYDADTNSYDVYLEIEERYSSRRFLEMMSRYD